MNASPEMQHWIVAVLREASLPGAEALDIQASADPATAWHRAGLSTGVDAGVLADLVAAHFGLDRADLSTPELFATGLLPESVARSLGVLALHCTDRVVTVATSDPVSFEAERQVVSLTARSVALEIAPPAEIAVATDRAYASVPPSAAHALPPLESGCPDRILVVDDDLDARLLFRRILTEHGMKVIEAPGGLKRSTPSGLRRSASSRSTSECPGWTGSRSSAGSARGSTSASSR
ncbi:MAG: hypothetical protein RQ745_00070 [Longimicrobiales bacterium]|nr:hypothetical protein [Longimicrobiales bacterium]